MCLPGWGLTKGNCTQCGRGTFSAGGLISKKPPCAQCPAGRTTLAAGAATCGVCLPGFATASCTACPKGSFSAGGNASALACTPCPGGQTTPSAGAKKATECAVDTCAAAPCKNSSALVGCVLAPGTPQGRNCTCTAGQLYADDAQGCVDAICVTQPCKNGAGVATCTPLASGGRMCSCNGTLLYLNETRGCECERFQGARVCGHACMDGGCMDPLGPPYVDAPARLRLCAPLPAAALVFYYSVQGSTAIPAALIKDASILGNVATAFTAALASPDVAPGSVRVVAIAGRRRRQLLQTTPVLIAVQVPGLAANSSAAMRVTDDPTFTANFVQRLVAMGFTSAWSIQRANQAGIGEEPPVKITGEL